MAFASSSFSRRFQVNPAAPLDARTPYSELSRLAARVGFFTAIHSRISGFEGILAMLHEVARAQPAYVNGKIADFALHVRSMVGDLCNGGDRAAWRQYRPRMFRRPATFSNRRAEAGPGAFRPIRTKLPRSDAGPTPHHATERAKLYLAHHGRGPAHRRYGTRMTHPGQARTGDPHQERRPMCARAPVSTAPLRQRGRCAGQTRAGQALPDARVVATARHHLPAAVLHTAGSMRGSDAGTTHASRRSCPRSGQAAS